MDNDCTGYLNYRTNYYEFFSEFVCINNDENKNYLNIICCNIRSINAHFDELLVFLENDVKNREIDIIVLTETWHNVISCNYVLDGYDLYFSSIKRNQNDGVMVFAKHYLNVEFFEYDFIDSNIVKLYINNTKMPINLICVYRSPGLDSDNFINSLRNVMNGLQFNNEIILITGDMNINIIGGSENSNKYLNMLSESAFISFINVYTRLPKGFNHSCLDHIFIHSNENVANKINAGVILSDITDHCMVCVSIPNNTNFVNNRIDFSNIDYNSITSLLANESWTDVCDICNDVNHCYNVFIKIIKNAIDKSTTRIILKSKNKRLKE